MWHVKLLAANKKGCSQPLPFGSDEDVIVTVDVEQQRSFINLAPPRQGPKSRLLEPLWAALAALLSDLGPVLGLSWACLRALLGHLGAILRLQKPIESEKARRPKSLIFFRFVLRILANLGPSWAILGPS